METIYHRNAEGQLHCDNGPAVIYPNGTKIWYRWGKVHRTDGPAVENADGSYSWMRNDKLHRENGPAVKVCVTNPDWTGISGVGEYHYIWGLRPDAWEKLTPKEQEKQRNGA
jgi:hypothetical protein